VWTLLFREFPGFWDFRKLSLQFSPFLEDKHPCIHCDDDDDNDHDEGDDYNSVDDDGDADDNDRQRRFQ